MSAGVSQDFRHHSRIQRHTLRREFAFNILYSAVVRNIWKLQNIGESIQGLRRLAEQRIMLP